MLRPFELAELFERCCFFSLRPRDVVVLVDVSGLAFFPTLGMQLMDACPKVHAVNVLCRYPEPLDFPLKWANPPLLTHL